MYKPFWACLGEALVVLGALGVKMTVSSSGYRKKKSSWAETDGKGLKTGKNRFGGVLCMGKWVKWVITTRF